MQYTAAQINAMLQPPMGQAANIDDGSLTGLDLYCKFVNPQQVVAEYGVAVEMTEPSVKVSTTVVADLVTRGLRDRRVVTGGKDYTIKTVDQRNSGFTVLMLKDA